MNEVVTVGMLVKPILISGGVLLVLGLVIGGFVLFLSILGNAFKD